MPDYRLPLSNAQQQGLLPDLAPIRVDIATPLDRHKGDPVVQLYFSLGQSF